MLTSHLKDSQEVKKHLVLISEFVVVQNKKSKLSANKRAKLVLMIHEKIKNRIIKEYELYYGLPVYQNKTKQILTYKVNKKTGEITYSILP